MKNKGQISKFIAIVIIIMFAHNLPGYCQCSPDVTPPVFSGGIGGIDQQQPLAATTIVNCSQPDLAQSFIPSQNSICGAAVFLTLNIAGAGDVTIKLYTNLPNASGILLATGTVTATPGTWAQVSWPSVSVTPGLTYYLVFTSSNGGHSLDGANNPYANGIAYWGWGYAPAPASDYAFTTYTCSAIGSCPSNISVNADPGFCTAVVNYASPVGVDNCSAVTTVQTSGLPSGSIFPVGVTNNTFEATDTSGNSTTCSFSVTVTDNIPPVAVCQNLTVQLDGSGNASIISSQINNGSTDNCGAPTLSLDISSFDCSDIGVPVTVTLTASDAGGSSSTCTATVTVEDNMAPVPDLANIPNDTADCFITITTIPTATDNCSGTISATTTDTLFYNTVGVHTITWSFDDGLGNVVTQTETIVINPCLGIDGSWNDLGIEIYPNPNNGIFNIQQSKAFEEDLEIRLIDNLGRMVYTQVLFTNHHQFDFSNLSAGTYYLLLASGENTYRRKIIIY